VSAPTAPDVESFLRGDSLDVIQEIVPGDPMHDYAPHLYFQAGHDALKCVRLAMIAAELETADRILDFACGGGRVLRTLKAAFPNAELVACDLWRPGLEFCSRVLGATVVRSSRNPREIELDGRFDIIWSGSLLTHVGEDQWSGFVKLFESLLVPGGVVVFTSYGRHIADDLRAHKISLSFNDEQREEVLRDFDRTGFGFRPSHLPQYDFGDCLASRSWVCGQLNEAPGLDLMLYLEQGWLGQDVIACKRRD
jgi:SAM-dependent methyltransferase